MTEARKRTVTTFTIVASLIPTPLLLTFPAVPTLRSTALYAAALIGYWGIVLMLWMYMLGTKAVTALIFTDLAPVLRIHKWLGKYATPLIFIHPLLIAYSYSYNILTYSIIPSIATRTDRHVLLGQIALWLLVLTWVVSALIRSKIAFRPWKYLHYLAYICIPFALLHVPDLGSQESTHIVVKGYLFLLGLVFIGFSIIRLRSLLNLDRMQYIVTRHTATTKSDHLLHLKPVGSHWAKPRRGQYVYIKLGFISEDHPFSVVRFNSETGELILGYRVFGMYTQEMQQVPEGAKVHISGPFGSFMHELSDTDTTPVVYLAGGIGITPFVDRILSEGSVREQWLFAANRNRETAVLVSDLRGHLGDRCVSVYNQEPGELGPGEVGGFITADLLHSHLVEPSKYLFYLCGPPPMMNAMRTTLASLGVPADRVRSEEFGW
jgi:predicted ferric reductase